MQGTNEIILKVGRDILTGGIRGFVYFERSVGLSLCETLAGT